jgi:protein-S-isoprenylcysteine O-methyltransferase Ste14
MEFQDAFYGWLLAIAVMVLFIATHGWRGLPRWQRWYLIATAIAIPLLVYPVFAISVAGDQGADIYKMIRNPEYWDELIVVVLCNVIVFTGIGAGIVLLVKITAEKVRSWNRSGVNS